MKQGALRAATIALFAMAAGVVAPRPAGAQDVACDQGELEVRDLEFSGNRALSDDELEVSVATTETALFRRTLRVAIGAKRCLDRDALPRDVLSLLSLYRQRGFYETRVDTLVQELGQNGARVVFTIEEGRPTILRSYAVAGLEGIPDSAALVNARRLRVGDRFDSSLLFADMDTIRQRLRNAGYYRADLLSPAYVRNSDSLIADVTLTVLPGARARFGEPVFEVTPQNGRGQQISDEVARRVLGIVPGSRYSDRAVMNAQRALFQLGTYRHVDVAIPDSLQPAGDTVVVLLVRLSEGYTRQIDSEFGWATLDCGRVRLNYVDRNWLGTARRLELTGQASKIGYGEPLATEFTRRLCDFNRQSALFEDREFSEHLHYHAGVAMAQPRLLGTLWVPTLSLYSERRGEYRAYLRTTFAGADLSAVRDVADRTQLRFGYGMEYGKTDAENAAFCAIFNRCTQEEQEQLSEEATLGVLSARLTRFRTDNPLAPNRGTILRAEVRSSASQLLGTSPNFFFNKATSDAALYVPFGWRNVLSLRLRLGLVQGRPSAPGEVGFVPTQERLYAGGATSVRGFQQNELGSLVYISQGVGKRIDTTVVGVVGTETIYQMEAIADPDTLRVDRTVPLGGNALIVANIDYRIRDPFLFPDLLQYNFFVDFGEVWTPSAPDRSLRFTGLKMTPGIGLRAFTPIGPVQVNVGYNDYERRTGPLFYNPTVDRLHCVTPGNSIQLRRNAAGELEQVDDKIPCPGTFQPTRPSGFFQRLTFTFSIGSEF